MKKPSDYKIMVVDDETDLRDAISFDLKRKGYQVSAASGGHEALALALKNPVDLILTDVRMPEGDGIELLKKIKDLDACLPVVMFITGYAELTLEEAYEMGADAIFGKPFDRKVLLSAVERALQPPDVRYRRQDSRVDLDVFTGVKFLESGHEAQTRARNIARGGMFVLLGEKFPQVGEKCRFLIECDTPIVLRVSGEGVVRWVRNASQDGDLTAGAGIEFISFDDGCRTEVLELINLTKTRTFIPRR